MFLRQSVRLLSLMIAILFMGACGASTAAVHKGQSDIQTRTSSHIFLEPVPANQRTVFLNIKNTSDKAMLPLEPSIHKILEQKGYQIVDRLEQAHYLLQVSILQLGAGDRHSLQQTLDQGFGVALSTLHDAKVQDKVYGMVSDVQISERMGSSMEIKQKPRSKLKQITNGMQEVVATETVTWKRYQTRVVSTTMHMNLKLDKAVSKLAVGLSRTITGFF